MTDENKRAAIAAEWERSSEALEDARLLKNAGRPVGAMSRAYYAAFHAARALLLSLGLQPRTHEGVRTMIGLHFVRTGRVPSRLARVLSHAARDREDADYDATAVFSEDDAREAIERAEEMREAARGILDSEGWLERG